MIVFYLKFKKNYIVFLFLLALIPNSNFFSQTRLFTTPLSERIANYDINVTLDATKHKLNGYEILHWKNTSTDEINELRFHLYLNAFKNNRSTFMIESGGRHRGISKNGKVWGWCKINKLQIINGKDLTDKIEFIQPDDTNRYDQTVIRIPLENPLLPNQSINLQIDFTSKLPNIFARTGYEKSFYLIGQWFPKIGVYESAASLNEQKGKWNCHQFHANSEFFADFGVYNVNITLPQKFIVGATGFLQKEIKNNNGTKTLTYHAEDVIDFAWTAYPKFLTKQTKWKQVNIKVLLPEEHFMFADKYLHSVTSALNYLDKYVGKYPYNTLTIVDPPFFAGGAGGMEYPTFITGMSIWGVPDFVSIIETVTTHEFSHNYFMAMLASNEFEEPWLDEGFTQYFETRIMDSTYGMHNSVINLFGFHIGDFEMTRAGYVSMKNPNISSNAPFAWQFPANYGTLTYNKTATWLTTLERMLGKDTMTEIIKTYFKKWSFKHPKGKDFITIVNEIVLKRHGTKFGNNMNWFFDETVFGTGICDYKVARIVNKRITEPEGIFKNSLIVEKDTENKKKKNEFKYNPEVMIHRVGEIKLPVDILIHFGNGERVLKTWDGKKRTKIFKFKNTAKVDWVKVDPNYKITMDINLTNNSLTVKPKRKVVEKYTTKFLFWLENIMLSFGMLF